MYGVDCVSGVEAGFNNLFDWTDVLIEAFVGQKKNEKGQVVSDLMLSGLCKEITKNYSQPR